MSSTRAGGEFLRQLHDLEQKQATDGEIGEKTMSEQLAPFEKMDFYEDDPLFSVTFLKARSVRDIYPRSDEWRVSLPHQCDEWDIVSAPTREEAVRQLSSFIRLTQEAMARLKGLVVDD